MDDDKKQFYSHCNRRFFHSFDDLIENEKNWNLEQISDESLSYMVNIFKKDILLNFSIYDKKINNHKMKLILETVFLDVFRSLENYFTEEKESYAIFND